MIELSQTYKTWDQKYPKSHLLSVPEGGFRFSVSPGETVASLIVGTSLIVIYMPRKCNIEYVCEPASFGVGSLLCIG